VGDTGVKQKGEALALRALFSPKPSAERMLNSKLEGFHATFRPFDHAANNSDDFDLVVPLKLDAMRWLNTEAGAALRQKALVPNDRVLDLCDDKLAFARFLQAQGFGDMVPQLGPPLTFPYMLKRRSDEWGRNSHLVRDAADEARLQDLIGSDAYYRQAYVPGRAEYATHLLVDGTRVTDCGTIRIRFHDEGTVFTEGVKPQGFTRAGNVAHVKRFAAILVRLGFEGLCCFDYKIVDGRIQLFELNPRFGGSLGFSPNGALRAYAKSVALRGRGTASE
jgi:hypothetical protein